jgi:NAD+ synthase/NAD+ synthase (glutamine-hydrolysing)
MRISLLQTTPVIGDLAGNAAALIEGLRTAHLEGARVVVAPELALTGYPPRDLLERLDFLHAVESVVAELAERTADLEPVLVFGAPRASHGPGKPLVNAAIVMHRGRIVAEHAKVLLPTYDVFDERRYFQPGAGLTFTDVAGLRLALSVCEDIWNDPAMGAGDVYPTNPLDDLVGEQIDLFINISASPYHHGKPAYRDTLVANVARRANAPVVYVNQAGGQDELVFDGLSLLVDAAGDVIARGRPFEAELLTVDTAGPALPVATPPDLELTWRALVRGLSDYMGRTGFSNALLGLSGGIDSAVTAAIACDAIGAQNVLGVAMPSRYSSDGSVVDALALGEAAGMRVITLPIESPFVSLLELLGPAFEGRPEDVTEENLQARIRGTMLMALSNKQGRLLLSTGNKSEVAVGYSTLYGDMCGGISVISDVPKTMVYALARWRNSQSPIIPESTITKPPSAELRPDQLDLDSLPPYDVLDAIIEGFIEEGASVDELCNRGMERVVVERVIRMIERNEYKRRQAAPGLRVTARAFGQGRRFPVVTAWSATRPRPTVASHDSAQGRKPPNE